jgi:hypothetical protein
VIDDSAFAWGATLGAVANAALVAPAEYDAHDQEKHDSDSGSDEPAAFLRQRHHHRHPNRGIVV